MTNIVDFHSPKRVETIYDEAIAHIQKCLDLLDGLPDAQFYPLLDFASQQITGGCSQRQLILQDLLFYENSGRGGREA